MRHLVAVLVGCLALACNDGNASTLFLEPSGASAGTTSAAECPGGCPVQAPVCAAGACVECATAADCDPTLVCDDNRCVECATSADCPDGQSCDATLNDCVTSCSQNVPCEAGQCDVERGICVQCLQDPDCTDEDKRVCRPGVGSCVGCLTDDDCTDPEKPGCVVATNVCDECSRDEHCAAGRLCRLSDGKCEEPEGAAP